QANQKKLEALGQTKPDEKRKTPPPAPDDKHSRDRLKDAISEIQKQISALRQISAEVETEGGRVVSVRTKILQALGEANVIPFEDALDLEESLLKSQRKLDLELIETRKQFIDDNAVILKQLAEEQARADKQKDKSGADRRVRQTEALVLVTKEANAE